MKFAHYFSVVIFSTILYSPLAKSILPVFPTIVGDQQFREKVTDALNLLYSRAPTALGFVNKVLKQIQTFEKSGMCVWCNPPTFQLFPKPENLETFWLASTIAHESYHSYLYQKNKAQLKGDEPPYDTYAGIEVEKKCNEYQLRVLHAINAPDYIIQYMLKQDGTHCDLNHDGKCDYEDYKLRQYSRKGQSGTTTQPLIDEDMFALSDL